MDEVAEETKSCRVRRRFAHQLCMQSECLSATESSNTPNVLVRSERVISSGVGLLLRM